MSPRLTGTVPLVVAPPLLPLPDRPLLEDQDRSLLTAVAVEPRASNALEAALETAALSTAGAEAHLTTAALAATLSSVPAVPLLPSQPLLL
jgi:hypothetical protein